MTKRKGTKTTAAEAQFMLIKAGLGAFEDLLFRTMAEADRLDRAREDRRHAHELELEERRAKQEENREERMEKREALRESQHAERFKTL
jgi:hypothetical protein